MGHLYSTPTKGFRSQPSESIVMCTVCWDAQSIILLDFLKPGATINSELYIKTLIKLKARIAGTRSEKKKTFFLQHDNARPHLSLKIIECVAKFGWTELAHLPYSPEIAPSDFHLFVLLKEGVREQHFVDKKAVIDAIKKWTATAGREFSKRRILTLVHRCILTLVHRCILTLVHRCILTLVHRQKKCIANEGDNVEKQSY